MKSSQQIKRESYLVAYDPKHQTAAEIWGIDDTLMAQMPWGKQYIGEEANEVLKAAVQSDRIMVRKVNQR